MEQSSQYPQYPQQSQHYPQPLQRPGNGGQFRMNTTPPPMAAPTTGQYSQYPQQPQQYPVQQPQAPQKPEPPKLTRGGKIVLLVFAAIIIAVVAWSAGVHSASSSKAMPAAVAMPRLAPTATNITPSAAYHLAALDHPGIAQSDPRIAQYQADLDTLHGNTGDTQQSIANGTIEAQRLLSQKGHTMTLLAIMDNMKVVTNGGKGGHYANALAAWVTLVENS